MLCCQELEEPFAKGGDCGCGNPAVPVSEGTYIKPVQDKEGAQRAGGWTRAVVPDLWISKPSPFKF